MVTSKRIPIALGRSFLIAGVLLTSLAGAGWPALGSDTVTTPYPILFVTQVPIPADFTTIGSVFGNHDPQLQAVGRGGDLWIRYSNGAQRNLTVEAGLGVTGFQGADSIAVRDPSVHWSGDKALFSMVIGAPTQQYVWETYHWQIYEISGLGQGETVVITHVPGQPADYNNVSPIYDSDDRILFTSDRPRDGQAHLYPQLDEYEEAATVSGLWQLDPASGALRLLNHAPSGDFTPFVDSFGRIVFTQWDHLQRDQQADADNYNALHGQPCDYCTFNWSGEQADAVPLETRVEVYPEPRADHDLTGTNLWGHTFNHFFPWTMNQDGSELETLNHIGRHELHSYIPPSLTDDPNLVEYYGQLPRFNANAIDNMLQIAGGSRHAGPLYRNRRAGVLHPRVGAGDQYRRAAGAGRRPHGGHLHHTSRHRQLHRRSQSRSFWPLSRPADAVGWDIGGSAYGRNPRGVQRRHARESDSPLPFPPENVECGRQ